jgi:hypothetical protein
MNIAPPAPDLGRIMPRPRDRPGQRPGRPVRRGPGARGRPGADELSRALQGQGVP